LGVVQAENRDAYLFALDRASIEADILPSRNFLRSACVARWNKKPNMGVKPLAKMREGAKKDSLAN